VAEVMTNAMIGANAKLVESLGKPLEAHHGNRFARKIKTYLSPSHRDDIDHG